MTDGMQPDIARFKEPVDRILARFTVAWVQDKAIERRARKYLAVTLALGGVAAGGAIVAMSGAWGIARPVTVAAAAAVLAIVGGRGWRTLHRLDIDDRKLRTVMRLLRILRADIPRAAPVTLTVDLRRYVDADPQPRLATVARYRHAWLTLTAPLADGNVVTLALTDHIKRKRKRKRTVEVCFTRIRLAARLSKRYRPVDGVLARLSPRVAPPPLRVLRVGRLAGRAGSPRASDARLRAVFESPRVGDVGALPEADALLQTLGWLYGGLAAARRTA